MNSVFLEFYVAYAAYAYELYVTSDNPWLRFVSLVTWIKIVVSQPKRASSGGLPWKFPRHATCSYTPSRQELSTYPLLPSRHPRSLIAFLPLSYHTYWFGFSYRFRRFVWGHRHHIWSACGICRFCCLCLDFTLLPICGS